MLAATLGITLGLSGLVATWLAGVRLPIVSGRTYVELVKLDRAGYAGQGGGAVFIVLIGSDYRPGLGGERGDALHVLALNPDLGAGAMLNIPRDTCAQVPGRGTTKINTAHSEGGPELQAEVIAAMTGAPLQYAVSVDFAGFVSIIDGVGGFDADVPYEMSDGFSGAFFSPGPHHFDGNSALAFSRDRHDFGPGDIQRTWNQGHLIVSAFRELRGAYGSPAKRFELLALLYRHSKIHGAGLSDLFRIAQAAYDVDPSRIEHVTIPTSGGDCLGLAGDAGALFADFSDDGVLQGHAGGTPDNPTGR
jgi:LCP family protein required for cell wall assembly